MEEQTEWWWIDYLEDELEASLEKDLAMLLEHSQEDRDSFESFRLVRQWVRESDPLANFAMDESSARVRKRVMAAIEDLEIEPTPRTWPTLNEELR